ncbi:MAG TPA: AMP-dependent synthetase/ligase [Microbacteriaceae bacterium]|nr:AMP-dependent synthetase/ligase [Microbacteriaceae bacterium]
MPPIVPADPDANTTDLLVNRVRATPDAALFALPDGAGWKDVSTRDFYDQVIALAKGFVASGVQPGDKIGLICKTRYEWTLIDFAAWFAGAMLVPIYETSAPSQIQWILTDSGATRLIVETEDHFARFDEIAGDTPAVAQVWHIDRGDLAKLSASGGDVSDDEIERRRKLAKGADAATLIYTSGSTGRPKGCILTHSNFVELSRNSADAMSDVVYDPRGASTLLFITTAHVFARFISILALHAGVKIGHQPDTTKLLESLGSFKPSFLLAVPRVFEKVYNVSDQKAEAGGKGKIFRRATAVAIAHSRKLEHGERIPLGLKIQFALFDKLVYAKLRAAMGGRVKYAVSGSAPLGERLGHFYHSLGITILEGYGLTETTAPATINLTTLSKIGTVGTALPGVSVRIAEDGEVQVKGINVFAGYWNNPQATAETFDGEWFKTGDLGSLDEDGFLRITGRKKEIIVTAGGKNVAPAVLEDKIRSNPIVSQVVVVGDQRPYIAALVTLDAEMLPVWLGNNGVTEKLTLAQASKHPTVLAEIQRAIDRANETVSRAESIRKFTVLEHDFTEAAGYLTPKMSIKRDNIKRDFADEIDAMYGEPTGNLAVPE